MKYLFNEIEAKWQKYWSENQTYKAINPSNLGDLVMAKPKFYVLDMFPYPSGAGLHVGHPLGYIASDIYARYMRHKGYNVLHPMGYDSFGLPAEQYAIQTGQHPAKTTEENIATYRRQLDQIGFSFDWSREVRTSDPDYYKYTQWIFIQLFESYYDKEKNKALPIQNLITVFEQEGNLNVNAVCDDDTLPFDANQWNAFSEIEKQEILLKYRLTYLSDTEVNWCPALGTVLANDEVANGVSERGGHPVIRKKMKQWSMRITAYAERLLEGLDRIDWPDNLKEIQRNWIGKSVGASIKFQVLTPNPSPKEMGTDTVSNGNNEVIKDPVSKESCTSPGYITSDSNIIGFLLERAKEMRKNPTKAEEKLWEVIRNRNLEDQFKRQHVIDNYIVDFVCLEKKLIIEADDEIHQYQLDKDAERQLLLEQKKGYTVLRFSNNEILNDTKNVISKIKETLDLLPSCYESEVENLNGTNSPLLWRGVGGEVNSLSFGEGRGEVIEVFTTRPDTLFGITFMTLAPEHELVSKITTEAQRKAIEAYIEATAKRSERDRMSDVKTISGVFTGAYAVHPFTGANIPIWIGDYVLAGYGTGAVMAVPAGDDRDYAFANHFKGNEGMPEITNIFDKDISENAFTDKGGFNLQNSDFLNGLDYKEATKKIIVALDEKGVGKAKINYRLRDAVFSRQRYWGEPFPVYYKDGMPQMIDAAYLPILLPDVEKYLPTDDGKPPLGNASVWAWDTQNFKVVNNEWTDYKTVFPLELNTMPGWAGSSWYFNRYMDAHNAKEFASQQALNYWKDVDLYIGGSEHATGHLLYSRFWQKFLYDRSYVPVDEYAKKLINQGMILGMSAFVYRWDYVSTNNRQKTIFISKNKMDSVVKERAQAGMNLSNEQMYSQFTPIHTDVSFVNTSDELDIEAFLQWRPEYADAEFILDNGEIYNLNSPSLGGGKGDVFIVKREVEKMSKSKYNVVNPDDICHQYGADTLRMYEMFLGPLEQAKPWNTAGITGVHGFLKKLWKLYHNGANETFYVSDTQPSADALKSLHKTIKKVDEDIANFSFNTSVSSFMICVNELTEQKCNQRAILEPLAVLISPYTPHIAEELWQKLGNKESVAFAAFPVFDEKYLVESTKNYPISFNGKLKFTLELSLDLTQEQIKKIVLSHEKTHLILEGRTPKNVIIVPGKIVNIVG